MRIKILISFLPLFSTLCFSQSTRIYTRVVDEIDLESKDFFAASESNIQIRLYERAINGDTTSFVGIRVNNYDRVEVGSSNSISISSGLDLGLSSSSITQNVSHEEYVELGLEEFTELFDFINYSMSKANPLQKEIVGYSIIMDESFALGLSFDKLLWSYTFQIGEAYYQVEFDKAIDIIKRLKVFKDYLENN